jgi:hypothetical protein
MHLFLLPILFFVSCGPNLFKDIDPHKQPPLEAARQMELKDPEAAIKTLLNYLGTDFATAFDLTDNLELTTQFQNAIARSTKSDVNKSVSLLSQAVAQLYGLDPLTVALKLAQSKTSTSTEEDETTDTTSGSTSDASSGGANSITAIFPALPDPSEGNIAGFDKSAAILNSLNVNVLTAADLFKKALLLTATVSLRTKKLDTDGDGKISLLETTSLSASDATAILIGIASAAASVSGSSTGSGNGATAAANINALLSKIDAQEGATDEEKLRNYLANQKPSSSPTSTTTEAASSAVDAANAAAAALLKKSE